MNKKGGFCNSPPSYIECPSNASFAITTVGISEQGKFNQSIKQAKVRWKIREERGLNCHASNHPN